MSVLKIIGVLIAGFLAIILLANVIAFVAFSGTDSPAQAQPTNTDQIPESMRPPTPAPTAPPLKVGLDLTVHNWAQDEYGYGKVVYSVINTGDIEVEYLKVKIIIKDEAGTPIGVHTTYPCEYGTLRPGQEVIDEYPLMPSEMIGASGVSIEIIDYWEI